MNTTSHRVYRTGEGERGSEEAVNDLERLRIRIEYILCSFARFPFSADDQYKRITVTRTRFSEVLFSLSTVTIKMF